MFTQLSLRSAKVCAGLILGLLLTPVGLLHAQIQDNTWRYSFIDDPYNALPEQTDANWKSVELPANLALLGAQPGRAVWLRKSVSLSRSSDGRTLALRLGAVYDHDRVYINGELIGRDGTRSLPVNGYGRPRIYPIPDTLLRNGENLIAIRITGDFVNHIGITKGPVSIQFLNEAESGLWARELRHLVFAALYIASGIFFLILFQRLRNRPEYFWFGLFALTFGLQQFLVNEIRFAILDWFFVYKLFEQLTYIAIPTIYFYFHAAFFQAEHLELGRGRRLNLKSVGMIYVAVNALTALAIIVTMSPLLWDRIMTFWFPINLPFFLYFLIYTFRRAVNEGERDAIILAVGISLMLLSTLQYYGVERGLISPPHYFTAGVLMFNLTLAFALIYRLIELQLEVEQRSRRLDSVNVLRDRVFHYLNTFVRKPVENISSLSGSLLEHRSNTAVAANGTQQSYVRDLEDELEQLQTNLDDILELSRLEVISEAEYVEQVNFHDFITAVIPRGVITHHITVNPNIILNTSLELVNSLVIRLIDFPAFREFKHIDLIITSDLKGHVHFRFLMFHNNVRKTRQLYELLTGLNPERGSLWVKWAIVREIIRILEGHLDISIINRKFLRIDIELAGELPQSGERRRGGAERIAIETVASSHTAGAVDGEALTEPLPVVTAEAPPLPKLHPNMTVGELVEYLKARLRRR